MSTTSSQHLIQQIRVFVVAFFCLGVVAALQSSQLNHLTARKATDLEQSQQDEEAKDFRLKLLKELPGFGYENLVADRTFLDFVQYFGDDSVRERTGYKLSPEYFEIIINKDPRFLDVYPFLSLSVSVYAAMPERSVALMEQGLKSLSAEAPAQSYYVWRQKGIDELLFLGDSKAAQQSFETAAKWASAHSDPESQNVAATSRQTAQFLARNPNSKLAQVSAWSMIISRALDRQTREQAINHIEALGGQVTITSDGAVKVFLPKQD